MNGLLQQQEAAVAAALAIQNGAPSSCMPTAGAEACLRQLEGLTMLDDCSDGGVSDHDDVPSLWGEEEEESDWPAAPADVQATEDTGLESAHTGKLSWGPQPALAQRHTLTH